MNEVIDSEIVIIGAGVIGCATAYHLTKMGKTSVTIIEKNQITHGSTWHAAGLVGQLRSSRNTTRMLQKSIALYDELEKETGQIVDWKQVGSLRVASSRERLLEIKRLATSAKSYGLEMHLLSAKEAQDVFPLLSTKGVHGAVFLPSDGYVDPSSLTQGLAKGARSRGAKINEGECVTGFTRKGKRITEVITDKATYRCEVVVNCAGMWAWELGRMMGVRTPTVAVEHQFMVTERIPDLPDNLPTMRDPDHLVYFKPDVGALAIGGWEQGTKPFGQDGIREDFGRELLPGNWDRFEPWGLLAAERVPILNKVGIHKLINGPIPVSADGDFVMGQHPELENAYINAGFTYGIAAGGGAGEMVAEWIVDGRPSFDIWSLDVRRFYDHHNTRSFLYPRAVEMYGKYYTLRPPGSEFDEVRGLRRSPIHERLVAQNAVHGAKGGWERPNWFAPEGVEPVDRPSYERPNWFEAVGAEHKAVRERVGLIDQTSFAKFEMKGPKALATLQNLAACNIDKPVGSVMYSQFCNERGGIEADLTICRLAEDRFYIITGSGFAIHDEHWMRMHMPEDGTVYLDDVTSAHAVINICGPQSRMVLEKLTDNDVSNEAFKFATHQEINIGAAARVRAIRIGYVGELGWELHIPSEWAAYIYDQLWEAGQEFEIANIGYRAIDSLRMEKGYLYWSSDITPDYNPYEAGLGFRVHLKSKGDFIGRRALEKIVVEGNRRVLSVLTLEKDVPVYGAETIMREGKVLGYTTSANFGHTIGKPIVFGYLPLGECEHTDFEVESFGEIVSATRHDQCVYDPERKRLTS